MQSSELEQAFPYLRGTVYRITSPATPGYNCIAWAAGDEQRWWWPVPLGGNYWPPEIPREESLDAFASAFALQGYLPCDNDALEPEYEKIAIYVGVDGTPTHAARQTTVGTWLSKLGAAEDIEHATLAALTGDIYGQVGPLLKRPRASDSD